jgi:hypothetical protein
MIGLNMGISILPSFCVARAMLESNISIVPINEDKKELK